MCIDAPLGHPYRKDRPYLEQPLPVSRPAGNRSFRAVGRRTSLIHRRARRQRAIAAVVLAVASVPFVPMRSVTAAPVDPAFSDTAVLSGFTNPTAVEFASDGRVFVA